MAKLIPVVDTRSAEAQFYFQLLMATYITAVMQKQPLEPPGWARLLEMADSCSKIEPPRDQRLPSESRGHAAHNSPRQNVELVYACQVERPQLQVFRDRDGGRRRVRQRHPSLQDVQAVGRERE